MLWAHKSPQIGERDWAGIRFARVIFLSAPRFSAWPLCDPALAQSGRPGPAPQTAVLQEVVVTAQRQAQSLLSVPMAITASTGQQLERAGIREVADLQFTTPGLVPSDLRLHADLHPRRRQLDLSSAPTRRGDLHRRRAPHLRLDGEDFVNVDRVEVLKGAQGGLYGRNATGGVINIITRQPSTDSFHGDGRISYGEKSTFQAGAFANMPIGDKVALAVGVERDSHDPYVDNLARPNHYTAANFPTGSFLGSPAATAAFFNSGSNPKSGYNDQDFWAFDTKLLVKPVDNFKITIAGDYARKNDSGGTQIFNSTPGFASNVFLPAFFEGFGINFAPTPGFIQGSDGKFTMEKAIPAFADLQDYGGSITMVYSLPQVDLTSITAYRAQQTNFFEQVRRPRRCRCRTSWCATASTMSIRSSGRSRTARGRGTTWPARPISRPASRA